MVMVPPDLLEERRRTGADRWDEMWDGVLHMVPAPSGPHQRFTTRLAAVLGPAAEGRGLTFSHGTELYRPGVGRPDHRIPDLAAYRREHATERGIEGRAELVVEVRSPGDETYDKFGFYAEMGVDEVLVVDPATCVAEMFVLEGASLVTGPLRCEVLGLTFASAATPAGPVLRVTGADGAVTEVHGRP
ncbi:MAG: Uma2 family endonuclease [Actinomycetota bacterium]